MAGSLAVPIVDTERLQLRGFRLDDFDAYVAIWADPEVVRFITGKPSTRDETWARLLRNVGHWALLGFGYWAIEEKASGMLVGETGFAEMRRPIEPSIEGSPEIGWSLSSAVHGKGYATEAVTAAVRWGNVHFKGAPTVCMIDPNHSASIRVAEKCGYRPFQRTTFKGAPTVLFRRPAGGA